MVNRYGREKKNPHRHIKPDICPQTWGFLLVLEWSLRPLKEAWLTCPVSLDHVGEKLPAEKQIPIPMACQQDPQIHPELVG